MSTPANQAQIPDGSPLALPRYQVDGSGTAIGTQGNPLATNQVVGTPVTATNTAAAGAQCVATLAAVPGKTTCINQLVVTIAHASTGNVSGIVTLSLDGGSTVHQNFVVGTSTTVPVVLAIPFEDPLPAKGVNVTIVVTVPALANGGIVAVSLQGYQL